ncbi:DUF7660 family protein [Methylocystis heyeri]|uniref:DUF7660 family protein n=1 Tax=Methylocystis heyeri TaxID=391905 RepID=UPI0010A67924
MELSSRISTIKTKEDLAEFVGELRRDFEVNPERWENPTLEKFLAAMEDWIRAMDNYYINTGQAVPVSPTWKTIADILYASRIYE